uniref:Uncharacterized protein n=1 Tax=Siphoviridae sp. ctekV29 TaxID=2826406 RepID=A0A8S5QNA7_9CAUD|nr:MAG TPA: hypothetical protein [Siphoviridae sp. ctekV29]
MHVNDNQCHYGSFPPIRLVTGRRPRRFSLFMKIFRILPFSVLLLAKYLSLLGITHHKKGSVKAW